MSLGLSKGTISPIAIDFGVASLKVLQPPTAMPFVVASAYLETPSELLAKIPNASSISSQPSPSCSRQRVQGRGLSSRSRPPRLSSTTSCSHPARACLATNCSPSNWSRSRA